MSVTFTYTLAVEEIVLDQNCKMYKNGVLLNVGDTAITGDTLKIVCDSGYEISGDVKIVSRNSAGDRVAIYFTKSQDNSEATLLIHQSYDNEVLAGLTLVTTQKDTVSGSNNIFKIDGYNLAQINKDRFVTVLNNTPNVVDYGVNILGVINLPFEIDAEYILEPEKIKLGTLETNVIAPKISTDKLFYNLGDISTPLPESVIDYVNAKAVIHLPYAPSLNLELDYVLGYTINVEYVIDLYSGDTVINIKSSKNGDVIMTSNVNLGVNIPYMFDATGTPTASNINIVMGGDNHVRSPYIEIVKNIAILEDGFFTAPILDENFLDGCEGFTIIEEINFKSKATSQEKSDILNLLKSGVIFK